MLSDRALVLEAISQDASALRFAAKELSDDRELVLKAMRQEGFQKTSLRSNVSAKDRADGGFPEGQGRRLSVGSADGTWSNKAVDVDPSLVLAMERTLFSATVSDHPCRRRTHRYRPG